MTWHDKNLGAGRYVHPDTAGDMDDPLSGSDFNDAARAGRLHEFREAAVTGNLPAFRVSLREVTNYD